MTHRDFKIAQNLIRNETPFAALIMAAMERADDENRKKDLSILIGAWPVMALEYVGRSQAPGGYLDGELEAMQAERPRDEETKEGEG